MITDKTIFLTNVISIIILSVFITLISIDCDKYLNLAFPFLLIMLVIAKIQSNHKKLKNEKERVK